MHFYDRILLIMEAEGRKIHGLAAQARERGESIEALKLAIEAMAAYQKSADQLGFAEIFAEMFLTTRHLFDKTADQGYLIFAKHLAMTSVELAEKSGNKTALAIPYFNLAKAQESLGEYPEAVINYKKALENLQNNPPAEHQVTQRPTMMADFKVHLITCEYKTGDQTALERAEQALQELSAGAEISEYNKHVWVSGGHMRIAEMLKTDNLQKAQEHLQKAKEIIEADPALILRKTQWEKLAATFN